MVLGHLPAGYPLTRAFTGIASAKIPAGARSPWLLRLGLAASIAPDLDILYHYTIDQRQHLHHSYWTHMPFFWACVFALWGICAVRSRSVRSFLFLIILSANIFTHLILDTVAGGIEWLQPFSSRSIVLFPVSPVYHWWVWNYIFHWIFLFEVGIVTGAWILFRKGAGGRQPVRNSHARRSGHEMKCTKF